MTMMKRILALLLALTMVIGYAPISVGAEGAELCPACGAENCTEVHEDYCFTCESEVCEDSHPVCEDCGRTGCKEEHAAEAPAPLNLEETPDETPNLLTEGEEPKACPTCGVTGCTSAHENWCEKCKADDCGKEHKLCEVCEAEDCGLTHVYCEVCEKYDCGVDHAAPTGDEPKTCPTCGQADCQSEHLTWCAECGKDDCGIDHTASGEDENPGEDETPADGETEACPTCGVTGCESDHANWCEICKADDCGKEHKTCETCGAVDCTKEHVKCDKCGTTDCENPHQQWCEYCLKDNCGKEHTVCDECLEVDGHKVTCSEYKTTICEVCGELADKNTGVITHKEDCASLCTCEPVDGVHQEGCKFYTPVEEIDEEEVKVGDKIWIKSGSSVYKKTTDKKGHPLVGSYQVKIVEIITDKDGNPTWYKYEYLSYGWNVLIWNYRYVKVENTTTEKPADAVTEDENACTCKDPQEKLANHADSCPRKQYIKSQFEGKTAKEIYTQWETYDEATRADILAMLEVYDQTKCEELKKLVLDVPEGEQEAEVGDFALKVEGVPEDVKLEISNIMNSKSNANLDKYIDENSELLYAYDITLTNPDGTEWQPKKGQPVTVTLDFRGAGLPDGNVLNVLHEHDGELNELGAFAVEDGILTFQTDGFSKFYFYITYTFGGHSFSMSGGSTIWLSDLLRELNIEYSVSDVRSVEFTNPEVLKINKVGSDWKLESLAPFGSYETLTITFADGETIEIEVKDPVVYNYAVGSDITKVPLLATKKHTVAAVNNGDQAALNQTYTVNAAQITVENVKTAGAAEKTAGVHPAPDATHMIIYAKEGMAIDFIGGTDWTYDGSKPTYAGNEIWFWSWESSVSANYAIVKGGTTGQQAKFTVTTTVDGTKYYCNVVLCVVENSAPTKLSSILGNGEYSGLSIKNVPVTLYDYDGKAWNEHYNSKSGNYFAFASTVMGVNVTENAANRGWTGSGVQANGGGGVALMGILKDNLVNGLPVMSQGQQVDLFSTNQSAGKTVYPNVNFQFVYNEATGNYTYNAALNHAQYNSGTNTIELYKESLAPSDTPMGASHGNAGFYPFEDINKAYTNTEYTEISASDWKYKLENEGYTLTPAKYSTDIVTTASTDPASTVNMHYGIQVSSDFYMPSGKQVKGHDMVYEFTGDDDLWVFIDGKLVLDIGGGHTHVSGSFNLTTGEVWVEKYTKLAAADGGSYTTREQGTDLRYTDSFLKGLQDDQMHTIQIFYLERHSGVSNCRMQFNLPLVPSDAVNVSKNLTNHEDKDLSVTPDVEYTFTLFSAQDDDDIVDASTFTAKANYPYSVTGKGAPTEMQRTDANGQFKLKDGWIASFANIPRFTEVYVVEATPNDGYVYTESTVSVNKATPVKYTTGQQTETKVMQLNTSINFDFVNKMQTQPLTVEKQVVNGTEGLIDPAQKFDFTLDFTKDILETGNGAISGTDQSGSAVALTDGGTFQLGHDESVTIPRVPVNMTFSLKEANPDAENNSFDDPKFASTVCTTSNAPDKFDVNGDWTVKNGRENKVTVTNQQRFKLTITKKGIQSVDNHLAEGAEKEEVQSSIFTVIGKIGDKVIANLNVTVNGNGSTMIVELPVGKYTVTEDTDWTWRYTPDSETKNVTIPTDADAKVEFNNTRSWIYWLSGDNVKENQFTVNSGSGN